MDSKIFGIGLSKTGTTSLNNALNILGYRSKHFPLFLLDYDGKKLSLNMNVAEKLDAITDIPAARFYKKLDKRFPGSKFILTVSDKERWLRSCKRHFWPGQIIKGNNWINKLHKDIYGTVDFDKEHFSRAYDRHIEDVMEYFRNRKKDLLIMNIRKGDRWDKLCSFLGKKKPRMLFPRSNCIWSILSKMFKIARFRRS